MTMYVVGFMFSDDFKKVALIRKNRPEWQAGKLNGVGGHVENGELSIDAMVREFKEETGVYHTNWLLFAQLKSDFKYTVDVYCTVGDLHKLQTTTDEDIVITDVSCVNIRNSIENLIWLIQIAIDHMMDGRPEFVAINYP